MHDQLPGESFELKIRKNNSMVKGRLALVACFFIFGFLIVAFKATEVMLFADNYKKSSNYKSVRKSTRMEIVDRNGLIVATNLRTASIYANPRELIEADKEKSARELAKILRGVEESYLKKEFASGKKFTWVKRNITPQEQKAVNHLGIPGLYFTPDTARVYPQGKLLAHILGYVDVDNVGLAGVEREFEDLLNFGDGQLQLSIDVKLQHILHDELSTKVKEYKALGGAGMVVDVTTGEVIAMVSLPDFDPNSPGTASADAKFNRVTLGTYEMGSTFKGFTAAIALDQGVATPNTLYDATQPLKIGRQTIHDYHGKKRVMSLTEVLMYSSNIGTARLAMSIGNENLRDALQKMGMFDVAQIEIPERGKPLVPKRWSDIVTMTVGFGHGIAVSVAHVLQAYQAIVNGGYIHPLTLLRKNEGDVIESRKVLSKQASDEMRKMLRQIVLGGSGRNADAKGYLVAGKTGTAEKQEGGRYNKMKIISSFIATFPVNNPKYLVFAMVDEPHEIKPGVRPTAGVVAAPIIKNFVGRAGPLLGIKPQYEEEAEKNETYVIHHAPALQLVYN